MKVLCFLFGVGLFTVVSSTLLIDNDNMCEIERLYLMHKHDECIPEGYNLVDIFEKFQMVAKKEISRYAFQQYVGDFCTKTDNASACYNIISVTEQCKNSELVVNEINTFKFVEVALKFMCKDNGSRYMDLLNDDGPECYANNKIHIECVSTEMVKLKLNVAMLDAFLGQNTCLFIQAGKYCLHTYDSCINTDVKYHMTELNKVLNKEYQC